MTKHGIRFNFAHYVMRNLPGEPPTWDEKRQDDDDDNDIGGFRMLICVHRFQVIFISGEYFTIHSVSMYSNDVKTPTISHISINKSPKIPLESGFICARASQLGGCI